MSNPRPDDGGEWDIAFLITGKPLPAMLDLPLAARRRGLRPVVIILDRGVNDLTPDRALIDYDVITIEVPYKGVDARRATSLPGVFRRLAAILHGGLSESGVLVSASYDLLIFARLLAIRRDYRLWHQVRDLHPLQLSGSLVSRVLVAVERALLRRVDRLIVSSSAFLTGYYNAVYEGESILLENTPARSTWTGYRRTETPNDVFRIGFIGIIRYPRSLLQLVEAVRRLSAEGVSLKVMFAGGGSTPVPVDPSERGRLFEFSGPYEYTRDIRRLYNGIDLIYAVYDSEDANCQLAMPNKFYEAIITRVPILVAKHTFVEQEVFRLGIGQSVLTGDTDGLVALLRDAVNGTGWYAQAEAALEALEPEIWFLNYERAIRESVS